MLNIKRNKNSVSKKYYELVAGDVIWVSGHDLSFVRVKRGNKSWVGTDIKSEKQYSVKIREEYFSGTVNVVGTVIPSKSKVKTVVKNSKIVKITDLVLNEFVIVMSSGVNPKSELYQVTGINMSNKYSHTFQNPITKRGMKLAHTDNWDIYRVNDIVK